MADTKLTGLPELANVAPTDVLYVVDDPGGAAASRKVTAANLLAVGNDLFLQVEEDAFENTVTVLDGAWEDLRFPAQAINPAGAPNAATFDTTTYPGTLLFVKNQDSHIAGVAQMPHSWQRGSEIHPHIHWSKTTAAAGTVKWQFRYVVVDIGEVAGAYSAWGDHTVVVSDADTAELHALSAFPDIDMSSVGESCMIFWELRRDVSEDTYAATVRLLEVDFHYQTNKLGTKDEVPAP